MSPNFLASVREAISNRTTHIYFCTGVCLAAMQALFEAAGRTCAVVQVGGVEARTEHVDHVNSAYHMSTLRIQRRAVSIMIRSAKWRLG